MRNINNPALQTERLVLLSDKSNMFYQGHTALRSRTRTLTNPVAISMSLGDELHVAGNSDCFYTMTLGAQC